MPVAPRGLVPLEYPMVFVCHPLWGCKRAKPVVDDKCLLSSLARFPSEIAPHLPFPLPRWKRRLVLRCHRFGGLLPKPVSECQTGICGHRAHETCGFFASLPRGIVCAGVLVICLGVELALQHAPSLTSSLNLVEVETLPSEGVLLSHS